MSRMGDKRSRKVGTSLRKIISDTVNKVSTWRKGRIPASNGKLRNRDKVSNKDTKEIRVIKTKNRNITNGSIFPTQECVKSTYETAGFDRRRMRKMMMNRADEKDESNRPEATTHQSAFDRLTKPPENANRYSGKRGGFSNVFN